MAGLIKVGFDPILYYNVELIESMTTKVVGDQLNLEVKILGVEAGFLLPFPNITLLEQFIADLGNSIPVLDAGDYVA